MTPAEFKILRKQFKLTQAEMAKRLGVSRLTVFNWESERFAMPVDIVARLSSADLMAPAFNANDKAAQARVKDTLEAYTKMRQQPGHVGTHANIIKFWREAGFTPSPEAQAAIAAAFPDILQPNPKG